MGKKSGGRQQCRRSYCHNSFSDTIGGLPTLSAGAECVPCLFAVQIAEQGLTPDQIADKPELLAPFEALLDKTGWSFQDVRDSYARLKQLPPDAQRAEMVM